MEADQPLKVLFRTRPRDLLALTGDEGARVLSARVVELAAVKRSVDLVLLLSFHGERYVRHVEFQARHRADVALRCFDYAARLVAQLRLPVLTTVIYVRPPAPRVLAFRETLGGRVVHERRFAVVRLWELEVREALALGPGGAALVGLLLAVLQSLSEGRYTARQLARVIPEEVVMASTLFEKVAARKYAEGAAEGRLSDARRVCAAFVRRHHPGVATRVLPAIEACSSVAHLHRWALRAPEVSADEFVRLVTGATGLRASRRRAPRPARRARGASAR